MLHRLSGREVIVALTSPVGIVIIFHTSHLTCLTDLNKSGSKRCKWERMSQQSLVSYSFVRNYVRCPVLALRQCGSDHVYKSLVKDRHYWIPSVIQIRLNPEMVRELNYSTPQVLRHEGTALLWTAALRSTAAAFLCTYSANSEPQPDIPRILSQSSNTVFRFYSITHSFIDWLSSNVAWS